MWIKWITSQSNVWFVQVVQSGGNGGIMEEKLREEDAGRGEDGKNDRGGKYLNFWKCVGKIDRSEGEAGGRSQGDVEEEKIELSKNCRKWFWKKQQRCGVERCG